MTERLGSAFAGTTMEPGEGQTALVGEIRDQSHLYGILDLVRCLGLELVSVQTGKPVGRDATWKHGVPADLGQRRPR